jgi:hypothetical protein
MHFLARDRTHVKRCRSIGTQRHPDDLARLQPGTGAGSDNDKGLQEEGQRVAGAAPPVTGPRMARCAPGAGAPCARRPITTPIPANRCGSASDDAVCGCCDTGSRTRSTVAARRKTGRSSDRLGGQKAVLSFDTHREGCVHRQRPATPHSQLPQQHTLLSCRTSVLWPFPRFACRPRVRLRVTTLPPDASRRWQRSGQRRAGSVTSNTPGNPVT